MERNRDRISKLIARKMLDNLSVDEEDELNQWLEEGEANRRLLEQMQTGENFRKKQAIYQEVDGDQAFRESEIYSKRRSIYRRWIYYAAMLVLPLAAALFLLNRGTTPQTPEKILAEPGYSQAILILDNGKQVLLTELTASVELPENILLDQERKSLVYLEDIKSDRIVYNTLRIPRNGEYKLHLPDGTFIYLNAGSTLRYPSSFGGDKREVYLSGEAWFEVAHDQTRPFYVMTDDTKIRVYGTSFNVNTISENKVSTALLEGSLGITLLQDGEERMIKPGELAEFSRKEGSFSIREADLLPYIAWKDGLFVFSGEALESIAEKLANWYDVTFDFKDESLKSIRFSGLLKRYDDISMILDAIESTKNIKFTVNGKNIMVHK